MRPHKMVILVDPLTHRELKKIAAGEGLTIGLTIENLLSNHRNKGDRRKDDPFKLF